MIYASQALSKLAALTASAPVPAKAEPVGIAAKLKEKRRHERFELALLGRFMRANKQEYPCQVRDVSVGGAAINSPVDVEVGERIIAHLDFLGGIEGNVARVFEGGFAIKFTATLNKREKLAAQITWYLNRDLLDAEEARRPGHERLILNDKSNGLRLADGRLLKVAILDVSISGASVGTDQRPAIGMEVKLGTLRARVMRHHGQGIGLMFLDVQSAESVRAHFG